MVGKIGEKIEIGCFEKVDGAFVFAYNHPGNRIVAIVGLNKTVDGAETAAKNVAMQAASMNPVALDKNDVPQDLIEKEIEIAKDLLRQEGKPEDKIEMISKGKIEKYFKENTLLNQDYIMDNKMTVSQYLKSLDKDLTVSAFKRYGLGQ
jgi:elongation factor Ts